MERKIFFDRDLLVGQGFLEKSEKDYRLSQKGSTLLSEWRKNPFDASRFWDAPAEVQELMTVELEGLKMQSSEILSYLSRFREQRVGA